jgi:hypothetical protein
VYPGCVPREVPPGDVSMGQRRTQWNPCNWVVTRWSSTDLRPGHQWKLHRVSNLRKMSPARATQQTNNFKPTLGRACRARTLLGAFVSSHAYARSGTGALYCIAAQRKHRESCIRKLHSSLKAKRCCPWLSEFGGDPASAGAGKQSPGGISCGISTGSGLPPKPLPRCPTMETS